MSDAIVFLASANDAFVYDAFKKLAGISKQRFFLFRR